MRLKEFQKFLRKERLGAAVLINLDASNPNIRYFTDYGGVGALIIPSKNPPFLLVPKMELERAKQSGVRSCTFESRQLYPTIRQSVRAKRIGIEFDALPYRDYRILKRLFGSMKNISTACDGIRQVKTGKEIERIQKGCRISDGILRDMVGKKFKTESEIVAFLEYEIKKMGHEPSFPPIVATGRGASQPHYIAGRVKLRKGFMIVDFGVKYKGYCSDITRTFYIGSPTGREVELYDKVLRVQKECIRRAKPGVRCSDLMKYAKEELGDDFCHGLGHGIGVKIHELPNLKSESKDILKPGMVVTIEPGVYSEAKYGIRIEDDVLITRKGNKVLTRFPKSLNILSKAFK